MTAWFMDIPVIKNLRMRAKESRFAEIILVEPYAEPL